MLTEELFDVIDDDTVFLRGETIDNYTGINMANTGEVLKWIAKKGNADDWTIYIHFANMGYHFVETNGDKVYNKEHIQRLVPCEETVLNKYRF